MKKSSNGRLYAWLIRSDTVKPLNGGDGRHYERKSGPWFRLSTDGLGVLGLPGISRFQRCCHIVILSNSIEKSPVSTQTTESWSGRLAFVLASIGAAVGLGNKRWQRVYPRLRPGGPAGRNADHAGRNDYWPPDKIECPVRHEIDGRTGRDLRPLVDRWLDGIVRTLHGPWLLQRHRRLVRSVLL